MLDKNKLKSLLEASKDLTQMLEQAWADLQDLSSNAATRPQRGRQFEENVFETLRTIREQADTWLKLDASSEPKAGPAHSAVLKKRNRRVPKAKALPPHGKTKRLHQRQRSNTELSQVSESNNSDTELSEVPESNHSSTESDPNSAVIDISTLSDENDNDAYPRQSMLRLPDEDSDADKDVVNVIDSCLSQNLSPEWFGYDEQGQLQAKLKQFAPGAWLDDDLFRRLLQTIALPHQFAVVESLGLDISKPDVRQIAAHYGGDCLGLVFPFHLNGCHWGMGIFEYRRRIFITYDLDETPSQEWASAITDALNVLDKSTSKVRVENGTVPKNFDGGSCALGCCLALERFLCLDAPEKTPKNLRSRYLRRLLRDYQVSLSYGQLLGQKMTSQALSSIRSIKPNVQLEIGHVPRHGTLKECLTVATLSEELLPTLRQAISTHRNARIIQIIMECSLQHIRCITKETSKFEEDYTPTTMITKRDIAVVLGEIEQNKDTFALPVLRQRLLFMELDLLYRIKVQEEQYTMDSQRKKRNRAQASGEKLDPLPNSGKTAKTRVLEKLGESYGKIEKAASRRQKDRLWTYIQYGGTLNNIVPVLGFGVLLALPACTISHCDFKLQLDCYTDLRKPIEPTEYQMMSREETTFFTHWFPIIHHDLEEWNSIQYRQWISPSWRDNYQVLYKEATNQINPTPVKRLIEPEPPLRPKRNKH